MSILTCNSLITSIAGCPECGNESYVVDDHCESCGYDPLVVVMPARYRPQFALTAELFKKEQPVAFDYQMGKLWHLDKGDVQLFLKRIEGKFGRKGKLHGFIKKDTLPLSTPDVFLKYISKDYDFEKFVNAIMKKMKLVFHCKPTLGLTGNAHFIKILMIFGQKQEIATHCQKYTLS
ncbi:hypothetical protein [Photorhabdus viridis]|uniref:hypothetical protein n=1 Tax=Photorhabdus viridis TaxID=3163327 RepID=UPI0033079CE2